VKPDLPVIADINVGSSEVINELAGSRSPEPLRACVVSSHILWLFLLLIAGTSTCRATLVLTACSGDGVVVAADGLLLKPGGTPPSVKGCKIMQGTDTCFFSIVGVRDIQSIHYDLVPLAAHACKGKETLIERANSFEKTALPEVRRAWTHIKAHEPATYALMNQSGKPAHFEVIFSGGPPFTVAIVQYTEDSSGNMAIDNKVVDIGTFGSPAVYQRIGASENVPIYDSQHPEVENLPDVDFLRSLLVGAIQLESRKPKRIGQPIAILQINDSGARWVEQGACPDIKHHAQAKSKSKK